MTILLVDGDAEDRRLFRSYVGLGGMTGTIEELSDPRAIVEIARRTAFDCIVVDFSFARETGAEVVTRLRAAGVWTPVLCLADREDDVGASVIAAGATDFLAKKDLGPARLVRRLRYAMRLGRAEAAARSAHAQLEAERRLLDAVIAQVPAGIAVIDAQRQRVQLANRAAAVVLDEDAGFRAGTGLPAVARALLTAAFETGTPIADRDALTHDGRAYRMTAAPIVDDRGAISAGVITLADVTAEEAARAAADRTVRSYQRLLETAAHELRAPLDEVQLAFDALARGAPAAAAAHHAVARVHRLVRDLLTAEQIAAGTLRVTGAPIAVRELLDAIVAEHADAAHAAGVELHRFADPDVELAVVDRERIGQALGHLIANAIQYAAAGRTIEVGARITGRVLDLIVRDHGPGLDHPARARFYDRHALTRGRGPGAGLGFALVRGIALAHGGNVTHSPTEGGGATFTLYLPGAGQDHRAPPEVKASA